MQSLAPSEPAAETVLAMQEVQFAMSLLPVVAAYVPAGQCPHPELAVSPEEFENVPTGQF